MAQPTELELKLLQKFRQNVLDLKLGETQKTDMYLVTWIRARDNDLIKAEDMLRKAIQWRDKYDIDNIWSWAAPIEYYSEFPYENIGLDNEGHPVFILWLGQWNIRARVDAGEKDTYIRYVDHLVEKMMKAIEDAENEQFSAILDLKGFSLRQLTSPTNVETMLETFRRFEAAYPERLFKAFVINAPRIFPIAFALVKPLLSGRTLQKVQIHNSNENKWKSSLSSAIPKETLPTEYGGTNTRGIGFLNTDVGSSDENESGLVETTIQAGGKLELDFNTEMPNSILRWKFETVDFDIGFTVRFDNLEAFPYARLKSNVTREKGHLVCQEPGKYTIVFDNTYSKLRSKTLRYLVTIESDQDEDRTILNEEQTIF